MKWGWAIWNMKGADQARKCRMAKELGLDFVSFVASPLRWAHRNPEAEAATAALLGELGLGWTVHGAVGRGGDPEATAGLASSLADTETFAAEAGPPLVVSFDPGYFVDEHGARSFDPEGTARALASAVEKLSPLGTTVAVENWKINSRPEQFAELGRRVDKLGMLLDVGHMNLHLTETGGEVADYVASLPLPIVDLHLHDNDGATDLHLPLGEGTLKLDEAAAAVAARGYDGLATAEVCPHLQGLDAAAGDIEKVRGTIEAAKRAFEGARG